MQSNRAQSFPATIWAAEDIAWVAVFLVSEHAGWVTGERLTVAGGYR
jgi:NAD(P)-dependent dehydrogenase (short-subunit alcohol dehydrogenase family)